MNIFFLSEDPIESAQFQHDIHVRKMIVESAQLLCAAHHINGSSADKSKIYKLTHKNHPMAIWVRSSSSNYEWLLDHLGALLDEFSYRFDKPHKTSELYKYLKVQLNPVISGPLSTPPLCMPEKYISGDYINSYRNYYKLAKQVDKNGKSMSKYTKRLKPPFMTSL